MVWCEHSRNTQTKINNCRPRYSNFKSKLRKVRDGVATTTNSNAFSITKRSKRKTTNSGRTTTK